MSHHLLILLLGLGCGDRDSDGDTASGDAGHSDGGTGDGGTGDGGTGDGGTGDGGTGDGGTGDGGTDCPDPLTWLYDADGDGWGDDGLPLDACEQPGGYVAAGGDCDDISPQVHPGGEERCGNGLDEDCDGTDPVCALPDSGELADVAIRFTSTTDQDDARQPLALGDIDGDGIADLILGHPEANSYDGRADVFLGPLTKKRSTPDFQVEPALSADGGMAVGGAVLAGADLDGDGVGDLVVSGPLMLPAGEGGAWLLPGPVGSTTVEPSDALTAPVGARGLAITLAGGLDLSGDDKPDLVLGACCDGVTPGWVLTDPTATGDVSLLGFALTPVGSNRQTFMGMALGDVDGDGLGDLAVAETPPDSGPEEGRAYVVQGPIEADVDLADAHTLLRSTASDDLFGWTVALGDLDGDGRDDLVTSAPIRMDGSDMVGMIAVLFDAGDRGVVPDVAATTVLGTTTDPVVGTSLQVLDLDGDGDQELALGAPGIDLFAGGVLIVQDITAAGGVLSAPDRRWTARRPDGWMGMWMVGDAVDCGLDRQGQLQCWGRPDPLLRGLPTGEAGFVELSLGFHHACLRRADGTLQCWGEGSKEDGGAPFQAVPPPWPVKQVAVGLGFHTCGLRQDGSISCWGGDGSGDRGTVYAGHLRAPPGSFQAVTAGHNHSCALRADGSATCWGQVGDPPEASWRFTQLSSGAFHACGITVEGGVRCWGDDQYSQVSATPGQ